MYIIQREVFVKEKLIRICKVKLKYYLSKSMAYSIKNIRKTNFKRKVTIMKLDWFRNINLK